MDIIKVELEGRDSIRVTLTDSGEIKSVEVRACLALTRSMDNLRSKYGNDIKTWPLPDRSSKNEHWSLLISELILKVKNEWMNVYNHDEICHCRAVPTRVVEQSIIAGAHTVERISRETSACTGCGTCKAEVEKLINFRLGK